MSRGATPVREQAPYSQRQTMKCEVVSHFIPNFIPTLLLTLSSSQNVRSEVLVDYANPTFSILLRKNQIRIWWFYKLPIWDAVGKETKSTSFSFLKFMKSLANWFHNCASTEDKVFVSINIQVWIVFGCSAAYAHNRIQTGCVRILSDHIWE